MLNKKINYINYSVDELNNLLEKTEKQCEKLQKLYSRSLPDGQGGRKTYSFSKFAGRNNGI